MQVIKDTFDLGDGTVYYETAGAGTPLVLSHAAFLDSRMFDAQWEALAQQFRVIRYDMIGFGQSSAAHGPRCRRDDLRQLLSHLGITQAHLVGCSNGGTILLDLALEQPGLALSLTMVGSTPSGFALEGEPPRYILEMMEAMQQGDIEKANELAIRIWLDGEFREPDVVDAELREKALTMSRIPIAQQTFFIADTQPAYLLEPPAIERLHEVQCPTLVVAGALDHAEVLRAANMLEAGIPNTRKFIVQNAGHVPSFEHPAAFNTLLLDFLRDR